MARDEIRYRSGYKYQLVEEYSLTVSVTPDDAVEVDEFIDLSTEGVLVIKKATPGMVHQALQSTPRISCGAHWFMTLFTSSCAQKNSRKINGERKQTWS